MALIWDHCCLDSEVGLLNMLNIPNHTTHLPMESVISLMIKPITILRTPKYLNFSQLKATP